jgi:lipoprotein-anchoring transpeptidase ErfK/SrfK
MRKSGAARVALGALLVAFAVAPAPAKAAATVSVSSGDGPPGTIIVKTKERRLYFMTAEGRALVYPVGVGRAGRQWSGTTYIASKHIRPAWIPPPEVRRDKPSLPNVVPAGSPKNPMGAAALVLTRDYYAIHGTNTPSSIGAFVSYGCIRMHNRDIMDLFDRVDVGTRVIVQ